VGLRVIAITLAQLLLHTNNRSHLVHTADRSSRDSSIVLYQQTIKLHTADQYNSRRAGGVRFWKHTGTRMYHRPCFNHNQ